MERRQFLEEVMSSLAADDPIKVMLEDIKVILEDDDVSNKENALDSLLDYCEDIDLATDFDKIGGYNLLERLLQDEHDGIRWRAAGLVASLVQNNPYWQKRALELKLLQTLLVILDTDSSATVRIKALSAISGMARDNPDGLAVFLQCDGFSSLLRALQAEEEKLQTKAAFMLKVMIVSDPKVKDTLCDVGMVEQFVGLLQRERNQSHEHLLGALLALATNHAASLAECRRSDLGLRKLLEDRVNMLNGKPEHNEESEYASDLLKMTFSDSNATVDR